jgi:hypothetical protein
MPFTSQEITDAGKIGLDFYVKNEPIDQITIERPLYKYLAGKKVSAPGAKQYIVEQLRFAISRTSSGSTARRSSRTTAGSRSSRRSTPGARRTTASPSTKIA